MEPVALPQSALGWTCPLHFSQRGSRDWCKSVDCLARGRWFLRGTRVKGGHSGMKIVASLHWIKRGRLLTWSKCLQFSTSALVDRGDQHPSSVDSACSPPYLLQLATPLIGRFHAKIRPISRQAKSSSPFSLYILSRTSTVIHTVWLRVPSSVYTFSFERFDLKLSSNTMCWRTASSCHQNGSVLRQEIGWQERLRNDLFCVEWDVTP